MNSFLQRFATPLKTIAETIERSDIPFDLRAIPGIGENSAANIRSLPQANQVTGLMVVGDGNNALSDQEITMTTTKTPTTTAKAPRENSKAHRLIALMKTGTGASLEDMIEATGWQGHTVRSAMTGLRKRGYVIERKVEGTTTVWSLAETGA